MREKGSGPRQSNVLFYGDDIIAILELEPNETYVPIVRLCELLGLKRAEQERRVQNHTLMAGGTRTLQVELENRREQALCLRIDLLPLWLVGVDAGESSGEQRAKLELFQREAASLLWQSFKPQGFGLADALLPERHEQSPAEQSFVVAIAIATLSRHQMLIERQLNISRASYDPQQGDPLEPGRVIDDAQAAQLAQAVRRVAHTLAQRTRRNEYAGVYSGLHRQFGISSYRRMPAGRLHEALEWLDRWRGDLMGEPEPPPDI